MRAETWAVGFSAGVQQLREDLSALHLTEPSQQEHHQQSRPKAIPTDGYKGQTGLSTLYFLSVQWHETPQAHLEARGGCP